MSVNDYAKLGTLRSVVAFRQCLEELGLELPCDDALIPAPGSPLAQPFELLRRRVGNRFAVQPMEGWDATPDGRPTDLVRRRWRRFGLSGAKLIWGCEAVAVRYDGRANPNQLLLTDATADGIAALRQEMVEAHAAAFGSADDLLVGLQLTHSGRFARPDGSPRPAILYHHPLLDRRVGIGPDYPVLTDDEIHALMGDFVRAATLAQQCGFDFVDLKHCHGYLGHEFLSAFTRPGAFGGSLENRTRFLRELTARIRAQAPGLGIAVRFSAFDLVPYIPDPTQSRPGRLGPGIPESYCDCMPYRYAFGVDPEQPTEIDLTEPCALMDILHELGIDLVNVTGGSPYYTPHIQRPALYPPCDAYQPPEDPLVGVARHLHVARYLKQSRPEIVVVGSGVTYLQEFIGHVAQAAVREGWMDLVGLGRSMLAYPELPRDLLAGGPIQSRRLCRTFSDCTTAPRNGLPSGCYPLDPAYKRSKQAAALARLKRPG